MLGAGSRATGRAMSLQCESRRALCVWFVLTYFRSLTFPGVPSSLPSELGALSGLQSLTVVGNQAIPGMSYIVYF